MGQEKNSTTLHNTEKQKERICQNDTTFCQIEPQVTKL